MANIQYRGDWKTFLALFDKGKFLIRYQKNIRKATEVNALIFRRAMRDNVRRATYSSNRVPNAVLTKSIKRSSKPLIDSGQLFRSVTSVVTDYDRAEIGVLKGDAAANIAKVVHDGGSIPVTPKMRGMFAALADASQGKLDPSKLVGRAAELFKRKSKGWKGLKDSTNEIRIPSRPFVTETASSRKLQNLIYDNWLLAAGRAVAGLPVTAADLKRL